MKEAAPVAGKLVPPTINKRPVNNNKVPKQTKAQETSANQDNSPPKKKKPPCPSSALGSEDVFVATAAGASGEVNMLFSTFAEVLSERAAADSSQMKQLEDILKEAQSLESFLKEKKRHLRQMLAHISDKLQG